jgi:hypothetical protein
VKVSGFDDLKTLAGWSFRASRTAIADIAASWST